MSMYRTEFPDYDGTMVIPAGYVDASYHNDTCPHVARLVKIDEMEIEYRIWMDYIDEDKREISGGKRFLFQIAVMTIHGDYTIFEMETDDWQDIAKLVQGADV